MQTINASASHVNVACIESDFSHGEITLVYDRVRTGDSKGVRRLVFGVVEMIHDGLESGPERPEFAGDSCRKFDGDAHELNVRRVVLTPSDALDWYRKCGAGIGSVPHTAKERARGSSLLPLELPRFNEEPIFPNMVFDGEESFWFGSAFWGARPGGTRRHLLVSSDPQLPFRDWTDRAREGAREWLKSMLPVDILERDVLIGSLHLVLTNPVFGNVHMKLNGDNPSQVLLSLERWPGKKLPPLTLYVRDERPSGTAAIGTYDLVDATATIQLPQEPHRFSFALATEADGLLCATTPVTFLRHIAMQMGLIGKERRVSVPATSKKRASEEYTVGVTSSVEMIHMGEPRLGSALPALIQDKHDAGRRREAQERGQRWFDGDLDEATIFVRELVGGAQDDVLIVDPYFGFAEVLRFGVAAKNANTSVRILSSKAFLAGDKLAPGAPGLNGQQLQAAVTEVTKRDASLAVAVRVLRGERSPIHDRFIVIDRRETWLIGSSLNEFGSRGTMAVRLPYGAPVVALLEEHWSVAPTLQEWLDEGEALTVEGRL